jgi:hypothetical protein
MEIGKKKAMTAVERLVSSLESRIKTYNKNKATLTTEYEEKIATQNRKIADAQLQLKALQK